MTREQSIALPLAVGVALLAGALILRGWLGLLVALGALVPGGYIAWLGTQSEKQTRLLGGLLLMLVSLGVAGLVLLGRILDFFR